MTYKRFVLTKYPHQDFPNNLDCFQLV